MLDVTAAVIIKDGKVLIAKKGPGARFANLWEFPGGKIDPGETPETCIVREIDEELGIKIKADRFFAESIHTYNEGRLRVLAYYCTWLDGQITLTEHSECRWVMPSELADYDFAPADVALAKKLIAEYRT